MCGVFFNDLDLGKQSECEHLSCRNSVQRVCVCVSVVMKLSHHFSRGHSAGIKLGAASQQQAVI